MVFPLYRRFLASSECVIHKTQNGVPFGFYFLRIFVHYRLLRRPYATASSAILQLAHAMLCGKYILLVSVHTFQALLSQLISLLSTANATIYWQFVFPLPRCTSHYDETALPRFYSILYVYNDPDNFLRRVEHFFFQNIV